MIKGGLVLKVRWSQLGWTTNVYDSFKAKDDEVVVPEEKKVLNKEELENLVGITIIEK